MINVINKRMSPLVICSLICALSLGTSPVFVSAQSSDQSAIRSLTERFYAEYQKEDLKAILPLWSANSPFREAGSRNLQRTFNTVDKVEIKNLVVRKFKSEGAKASIHVAVETSAVDAKTGKPADDFGKLNRTLHFVKEGADWKLWKYAASEDELAAVVAQAKTEEERNQILESEKELVNAELITYLGAQGLSYQDEGNYPQATEIFRFALSIAEKINDKSGMSNTLRRIGNIYNMQGNDEQALESMAASLKVAEEVGNKTDISATLENIGLIYNDQADYKRAQEYIDKSLKIQEESSNPDPRSMARALNNIGAIYRRQGNFIKAMEAHQWSLKIAEEEDFKLQISQTLNNIGVVRSYQGRYTEALAIYQKSLKINYELNYKRGIAITLRHVGRIYFIIANYVQALEYYQRSLKISEELGDKLAIADTYNAIGVCYGELGNTKQAMEYAYKTLKLVEELGDIQSTPLMLDNIGFNYVAEKKYEKALEYYQKSLKLREAKGEKVSIAKSLINVATVHRLQGNYAQALEHLQKSFELTKKLDNKELIMRGLNNVGYAHYLVGNYSLAAELCEQVVSLSREIGDIDLVWQMSVVKGKAYRALNQPDKARQAFTDSISAVEELRNHAAGGEGEQQKFFEDKVSPYYEMVDLLISQNNTAEAFAYAEQSKGRVLLDAFRNGKIDLTKAMSTEEQEEEKRLKGDIVLLNSQIYQEKQQHRPDEKRLADLNSRLRKSRLEFEAFETTLYASHPELKAQRGQPALITLKDTNALIPDNYTALLEYIVLEDRTHLFVLTRGKDGQTTADLKVYTLNIKQNDLGDIVQRFRQRLASQDFSFSDLASRLYDLLLKPAHPLLHTKTSLIIVPDAVLWELPFQALQPSPHRYLIENHSISYAPSLTVLREMTSLSKNHSNSKNSRATLLAFGNPDLGKETSSRVKSVFMDEKLNPLPEAERQVKTIARLYGPAQSKVYTGRDAREETAKSEAGNFRILHLATHGILNDTTPMYSQLLMSQSEGNPEEDGLLEAWEIMKLDLKADLVVLSACETARGRIGMGEGMIGMSWALFVAGCPTTVVSQWKVESASTTELMIEFYKNLKTGSAKSEALRNASLKVLKNKQYRHPFYWAGFVVIGDGR